MFTLIWTSEAQTTYEDLKENAEKANRARLASGKSKSGRQEGLFKQVAKSLSLLMENPRHPGLETHEFNSIPNPYDRKQKVFEAYAQNRTPGAYRIFWCYGPKKNQITIIAITEHP